MFRKSVIILSVLLFFSGFKIQTTKDISVDKIDKAKLSKLIKERKGKILFLNLWATWCVPCREEFPSIVKLANEKVNDLQQQINTLKQQLIDLNEKIKEMTAMINENDIQIRRLQENK